ncbi:MAG: T9SS type A sorting domain-containing protein [Bacteroidota bacterium]
MKKYLLFFAFLLMGGPTIFSQVSLPSNNCGIAFLYDASGNRIKRYLCTGEVELRYKDATQNELLSGTIDLEGMLREAGFSKQMEAEIEQLEALLSQPSSLDSQVEVDEKTTLDLTEENFQDLSDMILFPNPTRSSFSIQAQGIPAAATLSIVDLNGRILSQRSLGDGRGIDVSYLPEGAYLVTLMHKDIRKLSLLVRASDAR